MASRVRFTATWTGAVLVAALVPLLGPAAPTQAAAGCTSEVAPTADPLPIPTGPGCDDTTPPETTVDAVSPQPNAAKWIRVDHVTFTFSGAYTDGDTDPITYECQLYNTPEPPADWTACTSPATYSDLQETPATPYTFRVRAVDSGDNAIDLTTDPFFPQDTDAPDYDQTAAQEVVKVDTVVPNAFVFGGPSDGSGSPVTTQPQVTYTIDASEGGVSYRCQLDGRNIGCHQGQVTLGNLSGGDRVFAVKVTDAAGNEDASAATKQFTVPYDLRSAKSWKLVKAKGAFAGQVLQTKTKGARIRFGAQNVREFRFLAPAARGLGKVRVRVGDGAWHTYNLAKGKPTASRSYSVRGPGSTLFSGTITVEALSSGKPVRIDALVFPPG